MLGLAAPRLLCLRQMRSTLKGTATAHKTRYMRDSCSLKDAERCKKKHKRMQRNAKNAKKCKERNENAKCRKVVLR
jgi:hypothetical protein